MENKQDIIKKLKSKDTESIQEAIQTIKETGDISIVPDLLDILLSSDNLYMITPLTSLLADIKDISIIPLVMEKLAGAEEKAEKANLLRVCWESSLDFSPYFDSFIELLINDHFTTALEAATVIENLSGKIPENSLQQAIARLKETSFDDNKAFLIEDTLIHLEDLLLAPEP